MINKLIDLLGKRNEIDNDIKELLVFPQTLFTIDLIFLGLLLINNITNFINLNKILNILLYFFISFIFVISIILKTKMYNKINKFKIELNEKIDKEYSELYDLIIKTNKINDCNLELESCKISRRLDFKCVQQEFDENFINEFLNYTLKNKKDEIDKIKFPIQNWDIYQIYGLKNGYIVNNKATLYMKEKLPSSEKLNENDYEIISMYINAIATLEKQNQVIYENKKKDKVERKIIESNTNKKYINEYEGVKRGIIDTNNTEKELIKMLENDEKFKGKDLSEVIDVLNKIKDNK